MKISLLEEFPLACSSDLGPYRRKDYAILPDEPRCELIYGWLYIIPTPWVVHQMILGWLMIELDRMVSSAKGLVLPAPLDVHLADHSIVQPDILYISRARRKIIQDWIEGPPDLVVEILSPGLSRRKRGEKLRLYAECGVREYWIVDPGARWVEFLHNEEGRFVVVVPRDPEYHSTVLPEVRLNIAEFWQEIESQLSELGLRVL